MFISSISGAVADLTPNNQTRFQCTVTLSVPQDEFTAIEPGRLIAAENVFYAARSKRYTILQIVDVFPIPEEKKSAKKTNLSLRCTATPIGQELRYKNARTGPEIFSEDTFPAYDGSIEVLDDDMTRAVIHHIAPESRVQENGSRIDIGHYRSNPGVNVGLDAVTLLRGNAAVLSARPRARTTIVNTLIQSLLQNTEQPVHIVYCDVNNLGTLSLAPLISQYERASILGLNDKFIPSSVFNSMRNPGDRSAHKRAVLDYLDMMILPSVLEQRRHDFSYAISSWLRDHRIAVFRPHEQKVDEFINEIRVDILDGVEEDAEEYISELMQGIAETYRGERFTEKNTRDMLDMVDEFSQESKSHSARRTLYDLKAEIESVFETYSKDIPAAARKSIQDIVSQLNDDSSSSLLVVQGQKTTDILRFIGTLSQTLIEERLKRLKIRVPVLFIFNNVDEYVGRNGSAAREPGSDRFNDTIQTLLTNGRRHGLGFCLTLENAASLDRMLAHRVQNYFIGPITFVDEPSRIADLLNLSEDLLHPAVRYEDGDFLFTSAESPYHRRVPLPVVAQKNSEVMHQFLDELRVEQERRRQEYMAQEEERRKRQEEDRKRQEEERRKDAERKKEEEARRRQEEEQTKEEKAEAKSDDDADAQDAQDDEKSGDNNDRDKPTTRTRRKRGGRRSKSASRDSAEAKDVSEKEDADEASGEKGQDEEKGASAPEKDKDEKKPAARKTARGRRGGRGRKSPAKSEDSGADDTGSKDVPKDTSSAGKDDSDSGLKIEEFDPDAGKSGSAAGNKRDDDSSAGDADAKHEEEEKKPRRSSRRRGTRSRKPSTKKKGEE